MQKKIDKLKVISPDSNEAVKMVKEVDELMNDQLCCNMPSGYNLFLSSFHDVNVHVVYCTAVKNQYKCNT